MSTRDFNVVYEEIKKIIEGDVLTQQINNIKRNIGNLKNTDFYQELQKVFIDCESGLKEAREMVEKTINAPIYTGVIGHYSHGKSSLLNAILLNQDEKEDGLLPIGEGVVTGKPTLIQFNEEANDHEFYKVYPNGEEETIDEEQYKHLVSERGKIQISQMKYFRICLAAKKLAGGGHIFKSMASNNIELLDTPGLGGPYWKDRETLREWVEEFKLIILCIKATEINSRVADQVNPFLKLSTSPVILSLTFWDKWKEGEDYAGIRDEYDARKKAKDLIVKYFPTLENCVEEDRVTFCSAKGYFQHNKMTISKDMEKYYTNEWNVDNIRKVLENYVILKKVEVLKSIPSKTSFLAKSKKEGVVKSGEKLLKNYKYLREKLLEISDKMRPSQKIFKTIKDKFSRKAKDELQTFLQNEIRNFEMQFQEKLRKEEITPELVDNFNHEFKSKIKTYIREYNNNLDELVEKEIIRELERYIKKEKTAISPEQIDELENELKENIRNDFIDGLNNLFEKTNIFIVSEDSIMNIEKAQEFFSTLIKGCKKRKVLATLASITTLIGIGIIIFIVIYLLERSSDVNEIQNEKRRKMNQLKKENSKEEIERRLNKVYDILDNMVEKVYELIDESLGSAQGAQSSAIKEIKSLARGEDMTSMINELELKLEELKQMK